MSIIYFLCTYFKIIIWLWWSDHKFGYKWYMFFFALFYPVNGAARSYGCIHVPSFEWGAGELVRVFSNNLIVWECSTAFGYTLPWQLWCGKWEEKNSATRAYLFWEKPWQTHVGWLIFCESSHAVYIYGQPLRLGSHQPFSKQQGQTGRNTTVRSTTRWGERERAQVMESMEGPWVLEELVSFGKFRLVEV